jgi:hypothetical protein
MTYPCKVADASPVNQNALRNGRSVLSRGVWPYCWDRICGLQTDRNVALMSGEVPEYVPFAMVADLLELEGVVFTRKVPVSLPLTVTVAVAL